MDTYISELNWLWAFLFIIGAGLLIIGICKLVDEIRFRIERRRYRRARLSQHGTTRKKRGGTDA